MMAASPPRLKGAFWMFVPVILLAGLIGFQMLLLSGALNDPSFALEEDYYQKAVDWDVHVAQQRENARLGWRVEPRVERAGEGARFVLVMSDAQGRPLTGAQISVVAFHNARANERQSPGFREEGDGRYVTAAAALRPGQWELRVMVMHGAGRFEESYRVEVPRTEGSR